MSSVAALFAMRSSGSTRRSAAIAGSSDGNTLSVTALKGLAMVSSAYRSDQVASCPDATATQVAGARVANVQLANTCGLTQVGGVRPGQKLIERHIGDAEILFVDRRLAARAPIEDAHREAVGTLRHRAADSAAAADQPEHLAGHRGAGEEVRLRARKAAATYQAV